MRTHTRVYADRIRAARQGMSAKTRTRTIQARVNADEYESIQRLAGHLPMTGDWLRGFLLERAARASGEAALLAEVLALRAVVLNTLATLAPDSAPVIAEFAEKDKHAKAQRVLQSTVEVR